VLYYTLETFSHWSSSEQHVTQFTAITSDCNEQTKNTEDREQKSYIEDCNLN